MSQTKNVVCPGCTLLCDDIEITNSGSSVIAKHACDKGQSFFEIESTNQPAHYVAGKQSELDGAIGSAVEILQNATAPLIFGLDQLTTQAQQTAWKIADHLGAAIDTTLTNEGRSSMFSLQRTGKVTASIGEIANRSDLVVFWFCDPETSHPRLLERLARTEHPNRKIVVIDEAENATAKQSDQFVHIKREQAPNVLAAIRAKVRGLRLDQETVLNTTGLNESQISVIAGTFSSASYGSIIYGTTSSDSAFDLGADLLNSLVRELNNVTRFVGLKLRSDGNAQSAENVLAWSTGYPFAINQNRKQPRYHWLEYSAETILNRRECDAVLFATGPDLLDALGGLSHQTRDFLGSIPKIALSPIENFPSDVAFQVGIPGLNSSGEFCRNDDVSLPVVAVNDANPVSAHDVLEKLFDHLS